MRRRPEFIDHLEGQLAPLGPLRAKSMFGGWGLYLDGLFCAIVIDDELYFKADGDNVALFTAAGSAPFQYGRSDGGTSTMNYYRVPGEVLEDQPVLLQWARSGQEAALRARSKAGAGRKKTPPSGL